MARYKIKAADDQQFREVKALAEAGRATIHGESERYRFLWTDELPVDLQHRILATGARIIEDRPLFGFDARRDPEAAASLPSSPLLR